MNIAAVDQYLAQAVASIFREDPMPPWPSDLVGVEAAAAQRVAFHGVALLIAVAPAALSTWPQGLARAVREQAGVQTFWETSHRAAIAPLLEAFAKADIRAIVTKGTALAYSAYRNPALRRRGDTDIFVPDAARKDVRHVLHAAGFWEAGDTKALQESWACDTAVGFAPAVDIHWRINASAAVSQILETGLRFDETIALDRLAPSARGIGPVDNLILTAINRSSHRQFGYAVGSDRLFEEDRLIWALDTHLLASAFTAADWQALVERVTRTGTAAEVQGSLAFAARIFGTGVPEDIAAALAGAPADRGLAAYYGASSHIWRLQRDVAGCRSLGEKALVLRYVAFPSEEFLQTRFPHAENWPRPALHLRRWAEGAGKLLSGRI